MAQPGIRTELLAKQGRASRYLIVKKTVACSLKSMEKHLNGLDGVKKKQKK